MEYETGRKKRYCIEVDDPRRVTNDYEDIYLRRVHVYEVVDGRRVEEQPRVFDIGLASFFGGQVYREIPEELAQLCVIRILEGDPPIPSRKVHCWIFDQWGLKRYRTERIDKRFSQQDARTLDGIISLLKKDIRKIVEQQPTIGFYTKKADIFESS